MIDPEHRPLSFLDYVHWGVFIFIVVFVGQLLVSLIEVSSREETSFLQSQAIQEKMFATNLILDTSEGSITVRLMRQQAPVSVNNIVQLAQSGFYDGTAFHRVVPGVLVQGGDPLSREDDKELWGTGGPGYVFESENTSVPMRRGVVALANRGKKDTNGSQFFIVTAEEAKQLDGKYSVIGRVTSGMDVVDRISESEIDDDERPLNVVFVNEFRVE
jgi:peptidyl-prolyl cis-trans isomerase B (cyclophilin B)